MGGEINKKQRLEFLMHLVKKQSWDYKVLEAKMEIHEGITKKKFAEYIEILKVGGLVTVDAGLVRTTGL